MRHLFLSLISLVFLTTNLFSQNRTYQGTGSFRSSSFQGKSVQTIFVKGTPGIFGAFRQMDSKLPAGTKVRVKWFKEHSDAVGGGDFGMVFTKKIPRSCSNLKRSITEVIVDFTTYNAGRWYEREFILKRVISPGDYLCFMGLVKNSYAKVHIADIKIIPKKQHSPKPQYTKPSNQNSPQKKSSNQNVITQVSNKGMGVIEVSGRTTRPLYLGATIHMGYGDLDLEAIQVNENFTYKFNVFKEVPGIVSNFRLYRESVPLTVALWEKKVPRIKCWFLNHRKQCNSCKKNGYHLEGRVTEKNSRFRIN